MAELIIDEELTEVLTLINAIELRSTSHCRGRNTIERLSLY
jgi:tRNA(Phe) wybutosine-synthesizing methylase Tyw3